MYTEEQSKVIEERYTADPCRATVDILAEEFGVSPRSIIGKLVSMKIYQTPQRLTKAGLPIELKRDLVKEISEMFGLEIPSLEKAEREHLRMLRDALRDPLNLRALLTDIENEA